MEMYYALMLCILVLLMYVIFKLHRIGLLLWQTNDKINYLSNQKLDNLFKQIQDLYGLYVELSLKKRLPRMRGWAGSPDFLSIIQLHARQEQPKVVVECGSGVSTVVLARCMEMNGTGHVYSLDHEEIFAEKTRLELSRHGLSDWATVIHAPIIEHGLKSKLWPWYCIDGLKLEKIDLLIIDGPPEFAHKLARYPGLPLLNSQLANNATIIMDDTFTPDSKEIVELWSKEFPEFTVVQMEAEKGCTVFKKNG